MTERKDTMDEVSKEERDRLWSAFDAASRAIKECKSGRLSGLEQAYGNAYKALAAKGLVMPLKKRYR